MAKKSPPTWRRGLKQAPICYQSEKYLVASHVEAWIETVYRPAGVRDKGVASHVEAWIETKYVVKDDDFVSRLPRGGVD